MTVMPTEMDVVRRTCLDPAWVAATAASLNVDPTARDPTTNAKLNPYLRRTLPAARFQVSDSRTSRPGIYTSTCGYNRPISGIGATVDANGNAVNQGNIAGTLVVEWGPWDSITLTTYVNSILLQEVLGYDVSYTIVDGSVSTSRMSTVSTLGKCAPSHFNAEVWSAVRIASLNVFANATTRSIIGYWGRSGHYTLTANVAQAIQGPAIPTNNLRRAASPDFWREYVLDDDLIAFYSVDKHNRTAIMSTQYCHDGTMGCLNGCSKSYACTLNEAQGKKCIFVAHVSYDYDTGYLQAFASNNNVPAYFCFLGDPGMQNYVVDTMTRNGTITFYHWEPDRFHFDHAGKFARINWPLPDPAIVATSTGGFGELGYGQRTTNPVNVDFPQQNLLKLYSNVLRSDPYLTHFLDKVQLTQLDINNMLQMLSDKNKDSTIVHPAFDAACAWVKANYATWQSWVDPLPLCSIQTHVNFTITGCSDMSRQVSFVWTQPDPTNSSQPYVCDGGITTLPVTLRTSRSCDWLTANPNVWLPWTLAPPVCDPSFFAYTISPCTTTATRPVNFAWLMPSASNSSASAECINGVSLPSNTVIQCDFVP
ncbi:hypothetical protein As57867_005165, partial [Aphanomyces stellatus]